MECSKSAGDIALGEHKDLERGESGCVRDDGDDRDCDDDGSECDQRHHQWLPSETYTSHNSSAPAPVEFQFLAPAKLIVAEAQFPFLANRS